MLEATLFQKYQLPVKSKATERGELLQEFTDIINSERKGTKFKPVTLKFVAVKVGHIPTPDLYYLRSICLDSKNRTGSFSKCFFYQLKVQKC